jgi:hypothetical protein
MFRKLLPLALGVVLLVSTGSAAAAASSWTLVDNHQDVCFYPNGTTQYYPVWLSGTWSHDITVSLAGAPSGSSSWTYDTPIPPGSSDGSGSLAYVALQIPSSTPTGDYTARLSAIDGASTQSVNVGVAVRATCTGTGY